MRVIFINDCAFVARTLIPFLRRWGIETYYFTRGVSLWDKTFKALINCIRALLKDGEDTIIHVNYAYQDAFLMGLLRGLKGRKIDVLHCHGSDVRWKQYSKTGFIVKYGLKKAKRVLVSTPDLLEHVKNAEYLPNPIDVEMFKPLNDYLPPRALYQKLWYEDLPSIIPRELSKYGIELHFLKSKHGTKAKRMPIRWEDMPDFLNQFGIFISCFTIPFYTKTCLEAMSCGLATIDFRHKERLRRRIKDLANENFRVYEGIKNRGYILTHHDAKIITDRLIGIYESLLRR